jgi:hypothetical protein
MGAARNALCQDVLEYQFRQQTIIFWLQASVNATEGEGRRSVLQQRAAGRKRRMVGMKLLSAGELCFAWQKGFCWKCPY